VRERHARLLADSRGLEPRARLAQAAARSDFLLRAARSVAALQNPGRALEALTALLLEDLVDVVHVVVRSGPWQLSGSGTQGTAPVSTLSRQTDVDLPAVDEMVRRSLLEDLALPATGPERRQALASFIGDEDVIARVDELGVEQLVSVPLSARGRTMGLLFLGRARGLGFGGSEPLLEELAERVAAGLDATLVVAESRYLARMLLANLAPVEMPSFPHLDLASFYRVAHESSDVGGDFIDVLGDEGDQGDDVLLLCGDVAGKGVEAAILAKRIRNAVRTSWLVDRRPAFILDLVNKVLLSEATDFDERLATAICLRLRPGDGVLRVDVTNAGHQPCLVVRVDGTVEVVDDSDVLLGVTDLASYDERTVELAPGDALVLHTDGITEARGADGMFGEQRLHALLKEMADLPAPAVVEAIAVTISEHLGDRPHDDIAVVVARYRPEPG
jgi:serine phosphatase RsbU (regulator of sigma subunit)